MPLLGLGIELIQVISTTIRVSTCKKIEKTAMFDNSMSCSWGINNLVVDYGLLLIKSWVTSVKMLMMHVGLVTKLPDFPTFVIVDIFFRYDSFPLFGLKIIIKLWIVDIQIRRRIRILNIIVIWIKIVIQVFKIRLLLISIIVALALYVIAVTLVWWVICRCSLLLLISSCIVIEHCF